MTASAGAWYRVGTVNVTKNNQTVTGVATNWQNDVIAIAVGDIFTLDAKTWYEVTAVASDTSITLDRGFEGATGAGQSYAIVRNTSGTILTRIAGQVSVQFNQKQLFLDELRTWLNSNSASETLTDSHGITQSLKTPSQMVRDHDNRLAELDEIHPFPWAMRKVEFEANRAQNNEMFAASGFVHFGNQYKYSAGEIVSDGLWTWNSERFINSIGLGVDMGYDQSFLKGDSKLPAPALNLAGVTTSIEEITPHTTWKSTRVKLPPAEDGTRTYDSSTGISVTHASPAIAFASETATNKVVTDRVDMWGFEAYLREINDADPFIYANGLIQSLAADIDGVTTVSDNVRPITYFAWYEGDTESRGRGVNWQTASEANRIKIASDPDNNIYFDDATGKFYQWCVRGRSMAGAGNGDWGNIDSTGEFSLGFDLNAARVRVQGVRGMIEAPFGNQIADVFANNRTWGSKSGKFYTGAFSIRDIGSNNEVAISGECYFLVCGTVNRLNQGAYHPSLNVSGAGSFKITTNAYSGGNWYNGGLIGEASSSVECFTSSLSHTGGDYDGSIQGNINSGGSASGRPDGRFYDAIYASGHGGVCRDMRYSAWGLTQEDFAEADLRVKSGEYRGREKTKACILVTQDVNYDKFNTSSILRLPPSIREVIGKGKITKFYLDGVEFSISSSQEGSDSFSTRTPFSLESSPSWEAVTSASGWYYYSLKTGGTPIIIEYEIDISVADEYTHTDVIGDPANILQTDALKDGWVGSWIPAIPDGASKEFKFTRKNLSSGSIGINTDNNGGDWVSSGFTYDTKKNSHTYPFTSSRVRILQYTTKANLTRDGLNSPVFGEVTTVFAGFLPQEQYGSLFGFSLIGKTLTGAVDKGFESYAVTSYIIEPRAGALFKINGYESKHDSLDLAGTTSPAFKALNYNVVENQQGFIHYAYTELKHNGTDWGDDGKIHIVDNQSTRTDDNGNTVVYGTARIVEPIGWLRNDK